MSYIQEVIDEFDAQAKRISKDKKSQNRYVLYVLIVYCIITGIIYTAMFISIAYQYEIGAMMFIGLPIAASVIFSFVYYREEKKSEETKPEE